jgi:N-acylneuraminate cytidylyltransferase
MKNLAIIPARGGSKRIPRKNIKDFCGKPIIAYSIEAALNSNLFEEIMVSTDDTEIANAAKKYGAKVPFMRSEENSNDFAGLTDVCIEVVKCYKSLGVNFGTVCCILPTALLMSSKTITTAKEMLDTNDYDCVFPVTEYSYPVQRSLKIEGGFVKMRWPKNFLKRSQDLEKTYHDAGQFYFIKTKTLLTEKRMFTEKSGAIILNNLEVQDIDTETDWKLAELKYRLMNDKK